MQVLTIFDFLLFPIYFYFIYLIFKKIRARYKDDLELFRFFTLGFKIKILMIIFYTLISSFIIRGDAVDLYFGEGKNFTNIIINKPSQIDLLFTKAGERTDDLASEYEKGYLKAENNYMVVKVAIVLCFFTGSHFLLVNLIIGFIAFLGSWQLFLFFRNLHPYLSKYLAIASLGIPNVIFWSSGISKDTICIACLGFLTMSIFKVFVLKNNLLKNSLIIILASYLLFSVKSYILFCFLPFYFIFIIVYTIKKTSSAFLRNLLRLLVPLSIIIGIFIIYDSSESLLSELSSDKILENLSSTQNSFLSQASRDEGSFFTLGEFDGTISGFINMAPKAIAATFFRPFIWEAKNIVMIASAIESLILLCFFLFLIFYKVGIIKFLKKIFTDPLVIFCVGFACVFAAFIGLSSFNFGSLVRYKIPCIPFFIIGLIVIGYSKKPI